jgi:hypothetical protein
VVINSDAGILIAKALYLKPNLLKQRITAQRHLAKAIKVALWRSLPARIATCAQLAGAEQVIIHKLVDGVFFLFRV